MARASTRSKTAASVATKAAKTKPAPAAKEVQSESAPAQTPQSKPKAPPKPKPAPRAPTRSSARGKKSEPAPSVPDVVESVAVDSELAKDEVPVAEAEGPDSAFRDEGIRELDADPKNKVDDDRKPDLDTMDSSEGTWCICAGVDDGTPMIKCEGCDNWYHFKCMSITQADADDIGVYYCPKCSQSTGKSSIMKWEVLSDNGKTHGDDEPEEGVGQDPPSDAEEPKEPSSEEDVSSEDEYVDDYRKAKQNQRSRVGRVQARQSSESRSPSPESPARRRRSSNLPIESGRGPKLLKRKSTAEGQTDAQPTEPRIKRPRAEPRRKSTTAGLDEYENAEDDPVRKYCLGKLRDVVTPIFEQYYTSLAAETSDESTATTSVPTLTEEQREEVKAKVSAFVTDLEKCIFETYSELDKKLRKVTGPKYKERFRTLTFNLEKPDRTELRTRITSGLLKPSELAHLTSTDLANEKMQQAIESAQQEALHQSILTMRPTAPRAKITHKGEQMIEDDSGVNVVEDLKSIEERMNPQDEQDAEDEDTAAEAVQSPMVIQSPLGGDMSTVPAAGFDISDFMDDLGLPASSASHSTTIVFKPPPISIPASVPGPPSASQRSASISSANPLLASALLSASQATPSFNLDSVWGKPEGGSMHMVEEPTMMTTEQEPMDDAGAENFDMFFDGDDMFEPAEEAPQNEEVDMEIDGAELDGPPSAPPVSQSLALESLPTVWNGAVQMPSPQDPSGSTFWIAPVKARQIGGRNLGASEFVWRKLFVRPVAHIEGRVPVESATKYLVDSRLSTSKELIAVAFTPSNAGDTEFARLLEFLIGKKRHALVLPWQGVSSKDAIGKDLYLVPFKAQDKIPDYIELLEDVRLPRERSQDMLLGVFVLYKGRLSTTPPATESALPPTTIPAPPTPLTSVPEPLPTSTQAPAPAIPSSLAALLPGGLTEEGKNLLQSLIANGGLSAVTASLTALQQPTALPTAQQPPLPPVAVGLTYGNPPIPGPAAQYPPTASFTVAPPLHELPQPMGYMGYSSPHAAGGYGGPGPSTGDSSFGSSGPAVHPSRQQNISRPYRRTPSPEQRRFGSGDYGRPRDPRGPPERGSGRYDRPQPPNDSGWRKDSYSTPPGRGWDSPQDERGWRGSGRGRGRW